MADEYDNLQLLMRIILEGRNKTGEWVVARYLQELQARKHLVMRANTWWEDGLAGMDDTEDDD